MLYPTITALMLIALVVSVVLAIALVVVDDPFV